MHQRKTWDLCDLSLPHNQALSFTNIDANSSRSNTRYKSSLASRCGVCQVCTAGWRDGLWVEVWLKHEVGTLLLLPAGRDQLAAGRRVCLLHGDQLATTMCFWKQIFVIRIKLTVHLYDWAPANTCSKVSANWKSSGNNIWIFHLYAELRGAQARLWVPFYRGLLIWENE